MRRAEYVPGVLAIMLIADVFNAPGGNPYTPREVEPSPPAPAR